MTRKALCSLFALTIIGCSGGTAKTENSANRTALTNAQTVWSSKGIKSYEYVFQRSAFVTPESTTKVKIHVENGVATSVVAADGTSTTISRVLFNNYDTVDKIFARVSEKIAQKPDKLNLVFDSTSGYLTNLSFDLSTAIADEEETYTITEFKAL